MRSLTNEAIQAFPIERETFIGTASNFDVTNYEVVHANEDGDITFDFGGGNTKVVTVTAGMDLAIGKGCETITSTASVLIS